MEQVDFWLQTQPDRFCTWLYWQTVGGAEVFTRGALLLGAPQWREVKMATHVYYPTARRLPNGLPVQMQPAINLLLIPLDEDRIEVQAKCEPEALGYFQYILGQIVQRWPTTEPQLRGRLGDTATYPWAPREVRRGRPKGSGQFANREEFVGLLQKAADKLIDCNREVTYENLALEMGLTTSSLKSYMARRRFNVRLAELCGE